MTDVEQMMKRLDNMALEIDKLRWRSLTLEVVLSALWRFSFAAHAGTAPQEAVSSLLKILDTIQNVAENELRTSDDPDEEKRVLRLEVFAETMKDLRKIFSVGIDESPQ